MAGELSGVRALKEVDALYVLPLAEFTAARNALEKELKKGGKKEEAGEVKSLKKPSVAQWALNQTARSHGSSILALIQAADRLRAAQGRTLEGGKPDELREAQQHFRGTMAEVVRAAEEALAAGGYAVDTNIDGVRTSLQAVPTANESDLLLLRAGQLDHDVAAGDVENVLGMFEATLRAAPPPVKKEEPPKLTLVGKPPDDVEDRKAREKQEQEKQEEQKRQEKEKAKVEARRAVMVARAQADRRAAERTDAQADLDKKSSLVEKLEVELEEARSAHQEALEKANQSKRKDEEAKDTLDKATRALKELES